MSIRIAFVAWFAAAACSAVTGAARPGQIIFAVRQPGGGGHWYENFGYYAQDPSKKLYGSLGRLCRMDLKTGALTVLLDDPKGAVRDPQVHYDGGRILFSYRPGGTDFYHLYEINIDGTGLKRLTSGRCDDIEPTYLPDDRIMFCSSRCNQWVPCWFSQVAVIYRCDAGGSNIQRISANIEHDNTPWMLADGRVIYERWEYVDRSRVGFHHLWSMNPDGTGQMVYYGNLHPHTLMIDAKPIPGTDNVVAIFSPGHGKQEHEGAVTIVKPHAGPDDQSAARKLNKGEDFRDPHPLSAEEFLVARKSAILLMDGQGRTTELYRLPDALAKAGAEVHEPRALRPRPREPVIPSRSSAGQTTGRLMLQDVNVGRRMEGVKRGEIRKLLVLESLPKPTNESGKMPPMSFLGTYTLERVLGTVPVEADGSAYFEVPAVRSLFFVALDENNNSVKRMQSFLSVMPGEINSCVGCHEHRTQAPPPTQGSPLALQRPASRIEPLKDIPQIYDYPRDIQPIMDRHCVSCHDYARPKDVAHGPRAGGVILSGDRGPIYSHSYYQLTALGHVSDGRDRLHTNLPPRSIGTSASPVMKLLDGSHYGAKLTGHEIDMIRYWIESAAPYPGTYAALGTGMIGGYPKSQLDTTDRKWPESVQGGAAIQRRCISCHDKSMPMPRYLSDDLDMVLQNPADDDIRIRWSRHLFFNLSRPEWSLALLAPLSKGSGGMGLCGGDVFKDTADADYQAILGMIRAGQAHLNRIKRFDMPGFRPDPMYIRELQRFGILAPDLRADSPVDYYAADEHYWRSLWPRPGK